MKSFLLKRIKWLIAIILLFSLTGYLGTRHWTFELTSHFKVQYFVLSIFCVFICLWLRQWAWASLSCLLAPDSQWHRRATLVLSKCRKSYPK
ncbi:MAG TPA: hypothetical protein EYP59_07065 [Thiotrichaceae bacterium]|nr:hypothetical protein [Thiotrichaceae bacterium]